MEKTNGLDLYFILYTGTVAMFILSGAIILFIIVYQKRLIRQQKQIQEATFKHQEELLHHIIQTQEKERLRIARDLHDDAGSKLSALHLYLADIAGKSEAESIKQLAQRSLDLIDNTLNTVRSISHDLLPAGLDIFGLKETMKEACDQFANVSGISVNFISPNEELTCHYETGLAFFRIMQELLSNTVKHSGATHVSIQLEEKEGSISFVYSDNGKGFDVSDAQKKKGLGLYNIESRISMINGHSEFRSSEGRGVFLKITAPLTNI